MPQVTAAASVLLEPTHGRRAAVTIVGVGLGKATVRVSGSGGSRELPVQVYDPRFLDTEELTLAFPSLSLSFGYNGTALGQVAAPVEIGTDSWGVDEFPDQGWGRPAPSAGRLTGPRSRKGMGNPRRSRYAPSPCPSRSWCWPIRARRG